MVWCAVEHQDGCGEAVLATGDKPFRRLEHFKMHDYTRRLTMAGTPGGGGLAPMGAGIASVTSVDAMFKRKRGRPPKNRIIEVRFDIGHPPTIALHAFYLNFLDISFLSLQFSCLQY